MGKHHRAVTNTMATVGDSHRNATYATRSKRQRFERDCRRRARGSTGCVYEVAKNRPAFRKSFRPTRDPSPTIIGIKGLSST